MFQKIEIQKKNCIECGENKIIFDFRRKGSKTSSKCKSCLKKCAKPSENKKLASHVPCSLSFFTQRRRKIRA